MSDDHHVTLQILAIKAGSIANYCDRAEHCEEVDRGWVIHAAEVFRDHAFEIAKMAGVELVSTWAQALDLSMDSDTLYGDKIGKVKQPWLQIAQQRHDRRYELDVVGQSGYDQLRHRALEASVLVGDFAREGPTVEIALRLLQIGLRLPTIMRVKLGA